MSVYRTAVELYGGQGTLRLRNHTELPSLVGDFDAEWGPFDQMVVDRARLLEPDWGYRDSEVPPTFQKRDRRPGCDKDRGTLRYMMEHAHWSPFEGVQLEWAMQVPLPIAVQFLRHRSAVFQQLSQRYVNMKDMPFFTPEVFYRQSEKNHQGADGAFEDERQADVYAIYTESMQASVNTYRRLVDLGVAKEQARMVLPYGMMTGLLMSHNLRDCLWFTALRRDSHAQTEAREPADAMATLLQRLAPATLNAFDRYHRLATRTPWEPE